MRHVMPSWPPVLFVIFVVRVLCSIFTLFSPNENLRGGGVRCQIYFFSVFFPYSANNERDCVRDADALAKLQVGT